MTPPPCLLISVSREISRGQPPGSRGAGPIPPALSSSSRPPFLARKERGLPLYVVLTLGGIVLASPAPHGRPPPPPKGGKRCPTTRLRVVLGVYPPPPSLSQSGSGGEGNQGALTPQATQPCVPPHRGGAGPYYGEQKDRGAYERVRHLLSEVDLLRDTDGVSTAGYLILPKSCATWSTRTWHHGCDDG